MSIIDEISLEESGIGKDENKAGRVSPVHIEGRARVSLPSVNTTPVARQERQTAISWLNNKGVSQFHTSGGILEAVLTSGAIV